METLLTEGHVREGGDGHIYLKIRESKERFERVRRKGEHDTGLGIFILHLDVIALQGDIYIPLSIASGKKPTGFVYQIEGTAEGEISTTDISVSGEGISNVTLGTLLYAKIPMGKTATFRILVEMGGKPGKQYKIVINKINYKLDPSDARYKKFETVLGTKVLKFR